MKVAVALTITLFASTAAAKTAPIKDSTEMVCDDLRGSIRKSGFQHYTEFGLPKLPRYNTYVSDQTWCTDGQYLDLVWLTTDDADNCPVFVCKDKP